MDEPLKKHSDVTIVLIFFITLAIIGVVSAGFFVRDYSMARGSRSWPSVEGVVLSQVDGDDLRYAYSFSGHSFVSTRVRVFSARFMKPSFQSYAPGEKVTVYVNPNQPSFSVLQTGGAGAAFVFFSMISGLCVFFGVGGVVWTLSEGASEDLGDGVNTSFFS